MPTTNQLTELVQKSFLFSTSEERTLWTNEIIPHLDATHLAKLTEILTTGESVGTQLESAKLAATNARLAKARELLADAKKLVTTHKEGQQHELDTATISQLEAEIDQM